LGDYGQSFVVVVGEDDDGMMIVAVVCLLCLLCYECPSGVYWFGFFKAPLVRIFIVDRKDFAFHLIHSFLSLSLCLSF